MQKVVCFFMVCACLRLASEESQNPAIVLSIDGDGTRGVILAHISALFAKYWGMQSAKVFDGFAGVSTGGVLAAGLTIEDLEHVNQPRYWASDIKNLHVQDDAMRTNAFTMKRLCSRPLKQHLKSAENKIEGQQIRNIDFIYVINLDYRKEKMDICVSQFKNYNIIPYRFAAICGWNLEDQVFRDVGLKLMPGMTLTHPFLPQYAKVSFVPIRSKIKQAQPSDYGETCFFYEAYPGVIGCSLSHLSVLNDAYESGYDIIWVLEDDFKLNDDPHKLSSFIDLLDATVGREGWDILYTDAKWGNSWMHRSWRPDMRNGDYARFTKHTNVNNEFIQIGGRGGAYSMIVNRSGMKKILDFNISRGIFLPYDYEIAYVPELQLFCLTSDLAVIGSTEISDTGHRYIPLRTAD